MRRQRRYFSPEDKVAAVRRHLLEKMSVSDLCEELDILPTIFYQWQKQLWAVPVDASSHVAAYRGDRVNPPPSTWAEFFEQAELGSGDDSWFRYLLGHSDRYEALLLEMRAEVRP